VNCRRTRSLLSAYIDSELTGQEMLLIRDHLSWCSTCQDERESLLQVKRLLSALPEHAPRPSLIMDLEEFSTRHPIEVSAIRFFRSITRQGESAHIQSGSLSIYGRRFAMAGVLSLMSVWFIVAPSGSSTMEMASTGRVRHFASTKLSHLIARYNSSGVNQMLGASAFNSLQPVAQVQNASMSLLTSPQDQYRSMPIIGAPPFGRDTYLGGFPSSQPTSLGSFVYTGYSVGSH
jgi:predicted anti-sigma-YlaC factor YlaD